MTVHSTQLHIDVDGAPMPAYLARPDAASGPHAAVIILQEIFGVNREVKRIADLVASAGYVALAPNYYHRTHPELNEPYTDEGLQRGFAAAGQVSRESLRKDVAACIEWLNQQDFCKPGKVATWGFCFGGAVAFVTAVLPGLKGAVCFYGGSIASEMPSGEPEGLADVAQINIPLLLVYGGSDQWINSAAIERTRQALEAAGKSFEIQVYPDESHAFFRGSSDHLGTSSHSAAVADAWNLVQAFFKKIFA